MKLVNPHKGTVLILALLMVAIVQIILISLVQTNQVGIRMARNSVDYVENQQLLEGGQAWANAQVYQIIKSGINKAVYTLPKTKINNRAITVRLFDVQSKINLNTITNNEKDILSKILSLIIPSLDGDAVTELIQALVKNGQLSQTVNQYTQRFPTTGLREISQFQDLAQLKEVEEQSVSLGYVSLTEILPLTKLSPNDFNTLLNHFSVVPERYKLNINTADQYSLMFYEPTLTDEQANYIISLRDSNQGFTSVEALLQDEQVQSIDLNAAQLTVLSNFYLARIDVEEKDYNLTLYTLLKGEEKEDGIHVSTIWQSYGTL